MVGGGIVALMLREMGWNDPLDFKALKHRGALYFAS
jgi:hypothetical protein